ncbi:MAG: hypothetical protein ACM3UP_02565 [Methanocella sp.]
MRKKATLVLGCLVLAGAVVYAFREAVLIRLAAGPLPADRRLVVMSPFRDRGPERAAKQFLAALKTDRCRELLRQAGHRFDTIEAFCAKEASFAPDRFDLINRITAQSKTRLQYIWRTAQPTEFAGFCEVTVTRAGTEWVVTDYQRAY